MPASADEYEVEAILRAKVVKEKGRKIWRYCVKWKNYSHKHNTWEPAVSFEGGSEHFIRKFWGRISTDGRDFEQINLFKVDEEFFPSGPPRGAKKNHAKMDTMSRPGPASQPPPDDSENEVKSLIDQEEAAGKRRRDMDALNDIEAPALKRKKRSRGHSHKSATEDSPERKSLRHSVPDPPSVANGSANSSSSRGRSGSGRRPNPPNDELVPDETSSKSYENGPRAKAPQIETRTEDLVEAALTLPSDEPLFGDDDNADDPMEADDCPPSPFGASALLNPEPFPPPQQNRLPAHRDREANPKVKLINAPYVDIGYEGAISAKRKFMRGASDNGAAHSGPSRPTISGNSHNPITSKSQVSSLGSTSIAGIAVAEPCVAGTLQNGDRFGTGGLDVDAEIPGLDRLRPADPAQPHEAPKGEELLQLSGYVKSEGEALSDYDEDAQGEDDPDVIQSKAPPNFIIAAAEQEDEPPEPDVLKNEGVAAWKQSTIFGPLTIGPESHRAPDSSTSCDSEPLRPTLFLSLDSAVSVPVILRDVTPKGSTLDNVGKNLKGPPGKFYKGEYASNLVDSLRMEGSCARLAIDPNAEEVHKQHLKRFRTCLLAGELFVEMIGINLLVMFASENKSFGQKFDISPTLVGLGDTVVVTHVRIEDFSAYAQAAEHADDGRW
ncbi:hypothetical protein BKA93DRAFT_803028 [Sparassis latifolia]